MRTLMTLCLLLAPAAIAGKRASKSAPKPPAEEMADTAAVVVGRSLAGRATTWQKMQELCDGIGHRLTGTPALERAVEWAAQRMAEDGLDVRKEPVPVDQWVRGQEALRLLGDNPRALPVLGLGNGVGTPPEGVEADVVVVSDFDALQALGDQVKGKIVLFNAPFTTYGETVAYRVRGPSKAAAQGAIAALVRSVTPKSLATPHTGTLYYDPDHPQIPAAAVDLETASQFQRMQDRGLTPRVSLMLEAKMGEPKESHNVVGEIKGRSLPDEIVVVSCHLDTWDVGQGAQDDGAGCVAAMEAGRVIASLDRAPKRTIRVVLYTNEENGLAGGRTYAEAHKDETHVAALEMDTGAGEFLGYRVEARTSGEPEADTAENARIREAFGPVMPLFTSVDAQLIEGFSGSDVRPLVNTGVLGFGLHMDTTHYWPIHHTEADTLDKIDRGHLQDNVAGMALLTWVLAEWEDLPQVRTTAAKP
ncbi:MAG: M28 family peptidase [Myxococcota bacterium]